MRALGSVVLVTLLAPLPLAQSSPPPERTHGPYAYHVLRPCRWVDTRLYECVPGSKPRNQPCPVGPLRDREVRRYNVQEMPICRDTGERVVPLGAGALVLTVTAVGAAGPGYVVLYEGSLEARPTVPTLTFPAASARSSLAVVPLGQYQAQDPWTPFIPDFWAYAAVVGGGSVDLVMDVVGYLAPEPATSAP